MKIHEGYNEQAHNDVGTITLEKGLELNSEYIICLIPTIVI